MRGRAGSPGFRGERLRQAREARGLTVVALSDMLGVTRQGFTLYENGGRTPGPNLLDKISEILAMPAEFFFREPPVESAPNGPVFYRSLAAATKTARRKAERRFGWLKEIAAGLEQVVEFPKVDLPTLQLSDRPEAISPNAIEEAAATTRRHWRMNGGPAADLIGLAEAHGIVVSRFTMEASDLDAFSQWPEGKRPFVVLNSDKDSAVRLRLDTAHEIGHQLLHRHIDPSLLRRPETLKLVEQQAFKFAGAFLLPADSFLDEVDVVSLDYLKMLKRTWGASIGAMLIRLQDLDVISDEEAHRLWRSYGMRGFRRREPMDDELSPERPQLLAKAVDTIGGPQAFRSLVRGSIVLPDRLYEELLGLAQGSISRPAPPPVVTLRPSESNRGTGSERNGDLVRFPGPDGESHIDDD